MYLGRVLCPAINRSRPKLAMTIMSRTSRWLLLAAVASSAAGLDNGLAITPPMGWRSWNLFGPNVNQALMERIMEGMVSKKRRVDGVPTSLCDLGYCDVGLDDNWQLCGQYPTAVKGVNYTYHDPATGRPVVNESRFPSFARMTAKAHALGLTAGWYGNNCLCADGHSDVPALYEGDVLALLDYGFDSWKLDGCGKQRNLSRYDELIRKHSPDKAILVENCHWGVVPPFAPDPGEDFCPWNFYRTSQDVFAMARPEVAAAAEYRGVPVKVHGEVRLHVMHYGHRTTFHAATDSTHVATWRRSRSTRTARGAT